MEINYTILGADGQQYGPVALEQLKVWLREGRLASDTEVLRSDTNAWLPAGRYAELGIAPLPVVAPGAPAPLPTTAGGIRNPELERQAKSGADWFYWIAGFSLVNYVASLLNFNVQFIVGLGMTQMLEVFAWRHGGNPAVIGLTMMVAGVFVVLGVFAGKGQTWAFVVGLILYLADALLCWKLSLGILMAGFHLFVLFSLGRGLWANWQLRGLRSETLNG